MESQSGLGGFNWSSGGFGVVPRILSGTGRAQSPDTDRRTFPETAPRPICRRSQALLEGVSSFGTRVIVRSGVVRRRIEVPSRARSYARATGLPSASDRVGLSDSVIPTARAARTRLRPVRRSRSVANRSAIHPTRLETRTKESNMCASRRVLRNPEAQ